MKGAFLEGRLFGSHHVKLIPIYIIFYDKKNVINT